MDTGKTSTFTIHHDACDPAKWTAKDVLAFADFVRTGDMLHAARLARLGVQLVLSEHHVPKGGHLEEIGWAEPESPAEFSDDIGEIASDEDVTPVVRIYRGPVEYVARIPIGDVNGDLDGFEYEIKPTEREAGAYFDDAMQHGGQGSP